MEEKKLNSIIASISLSGGEKQEIFFPGYLKEIKGKSEEEIERHIKEIITKISDKPFPQLYALDTSYSEIDKNHLLDIKGDFNLKIQINLPFVFHLPNGHEVSLKFPEESIVRFNKQWTKYARKTQNFDVIGNKKFYYLGGSVVTPKMPFNPYDGYNIVSPELENMDSLDNSGIYRYSRLDVFLKYNYIDDYNLMISELETKLLNIVNYLIDIYRNISKDYYIDNINKNIITDIFFLDKNIGYYGIDMNLGGALINQSKSVIDKFTDNVNQGYEIPIYETLLDLSNKSILHKNYKIALIEAFQAFDVFIEDFSNRNTITLPKGIFGTTKNIIKEGLSLKYNIKFKEKHKDLYEKWEDIYDKRNNTIHKTYTPNKNDSEEAIKYNIEMIKTISGLEK